MLVLRSMAMKRFTESSPSEDGVAVDVACDDYGN